MHHIFDVALARAYGVPEAIILQHFYFWIAKNQAAGRHFHDGRFWTYGSAGALSQAMPYFSPHQIRRILKKLQAEGVLYTGNYNKNPYNKTVWYALDDRLLSQLAQPGGEAGQPPGEEAEAPKAPLPPWFAPRRADGAEPAARGGEIAGSYKDRDTGQIQEREGPPAPRGGKRPRFLPPTAEEVADYCRERGSSVDPQTFADFYASKGWMVGSAHMRDWRAAVRTWEKREGAAQPERKVNYLP